MIRVVPMTERKPNKAVEINSRGRRPIFGKVAVSVVSRRECLTFGRSAEIMQPKESTEWPFDQTRNTGTITTTHVLKEKKDITHVYHDADDHGWQFHYSGPKEASDAMLVALFEIVDHDPSVLEVADLPPGWMAVRDRRGAPWRRMKNPRE